MHVSLLSSRALLRAALAMLTLALPVLGWAANVSGNVSSIVDGHALAGANVSAGGLNATTDSNGNYTIYGLGYGTYTVTATIPGFFARSASVGLSSSVAYQNFQLATGGLVQGTVTGSNGAPIANAKVTLAGGLIATNVSVSTDGTGNYNSNWLPVGTYTVSAQANGVGSPTQQAAVNTGVATRVNLSMSGGSTIAAIQTMTGWESCTATLANGYPCASGLGNAGFSTLQFQTSPSLSGSSMRFDIWGATPYSNALWWKQLTPAGSASHFDFDFWVYVNDGTIPQSLEFDMNQTVNNTKYIFGTQCNFRDSGRWDVWDGATGKWVPSNLGCVAFTSKSWNHFTWHFERTAAMVHYISLDINGVNYPVNMWEYPQANVNATELNVAVQLDGNYAQQPYSIWVDNMSIRYW